MRTKCLRYRKQKYFPWLQLPSTLHGARGGHGWTTLSTEQSICHDTDAWPTRRTPILLLLKNCRPSISAIALPRRRKVLSRCAWDHRAAGFSVAISGRPQRPIINFSGNLDHDHRNALFLRGRVDSFINVRFFRYGFGISDESEDPAVYPYQYICYNTDRLSVYLALEDNVPRQSPHSRHFR
jgi:hypothetical protein